MEQQTQPSEQRTALFTTLADAEAALHALQDAGVPYPSVRMDSYAAADLAGTPLAERTTGTELFWSLTVSPDTALRDRAIQVLRENKAFAIGQLPRDDNRANDTERGAIAWRHYVFETSAATDAVGEYAGTTGNTGVISSGAFSDGALAAGNPPVRSQPAGDQRDSDAGTAPSSDTLQPSVGQGRSRPQNELQ